MKAKRVVIFFIFCLVLMGISSFTLYKRHFVQKPACQKCNVIVIYIVTLRADHVPCFGYSRNTMPNLCAFAKQGATFTRAYAQSSWTLPSNFSILTSLYPSAHKMTSEDRTQLSPKNITLPHAFSKNGYYTAFVGPMKNPHLPIKRGVGRGFADLIEYNGIDDWITATKRLKQKNSMGIPGFLYLHTYDVHDTWQSIMSPYPPSFTFDINSGTPPRFDEARFNQKIWESALDYLSYEINFVVTEKDNSLAETYTPLKEASTISEAKQIFETLPKDIQNNIRLSSLPSEFSPTDSQLIKFLTNLYDESLLAFDTKLGRYINYLAKEGLMENTVIAIISDHGDSLGEHNIFNHGNDLYQEETHVPMVYYYPGITPQIHHELMQSIDIYPTLCGLAGILCPSSLQGKSFIQNVLKNEYIPHNDWIKSELGGASNLQSIQTLRWKFYLHRNTNSRELYDLMRDPHEGNNVIMLYPKIAEHLENLLTESHSVR